MTTVACIFGFKVKDHTNIQARIERNQILFPVCSHMSLSDEETKWSTYRNRKIDPQRLNLHHSVLLQKKERTVRLYFIILIVSNVKNSLLE